MPALKLTQFQSIGADRSEQTVKTLIILLLKEQFGLGLNCLSFHLHHLETLYLLHDKSKLFHFLDNYCTCFSCHFIFNAILLLLAVPRRLFCFGSLVILDVARCYLWLFTLYINIKISKNSC